MSSDGTPAPKHPTQRVLCYQFNPETDVIGKGAYGEVYKATFVGPAGDGGAGGDVRENVAALKRTCCGSREEGIPASTIREIMVLKEISKTMQNAGGAESPELVGSENIAKLYDVFIDTNTVYIASEYCEAGDLSRYLKRLPMQRLSDGQQYRQWMRDLLCGLCFLHRKEFSHRDLKPQNLVLKAMPNTEHSSGVSSDAGETKKSTEAPRYRLKITDFGLSRIEGIPVKKYQHEAVTLWYRSPDLLLGNTNYGFTADMWSAGCIIGEVASGSALFRGKDSAGQLKCIFARLGAPTKRNFPSAALYASCREFFRGMEAPASGKETKECAGSTPLSDVFESTKENLLHYFKKYGVMNVVGQNGLDLIAHLLAYEPTHRLTAEEALQHPFFSSLSRNIATSPNVQSTETKPAMEGKDDSGAGSRVARGASTSHIRLKNRRFS